MLHRSEKSVILIIGKYRKEIFLFIYFAIVYNRITKAVIKWH